MTFTTSLKEEILRNDLPIIESRYELEAYIKCAGKVSEDSIVLTMENASVARRIYKDIKQVFNISPKITVRNQKRFRVKQIYILSLHEDIIKIINSLNINSSKMFMETDEEKIAFIQGAFLAIGNIINPQSGRYHLEFICNTDEVAENILYLLRYFKFNAKIVDRGYKHVVYIKSSENISDLIKMFKATNSLFFFEDIRIYRDHKNMVNRLNNCEISNQTRSIQTGQNQLDDIKYLRSHDLLDLLDEHTKIVITAREKYPECSLLELAEIITLEYNYKIGKSGVNHHFIKIKELVKKHKKNNEDIDG